MKPSTKFFTFVLIPFFGIIAGGIATALSFDLFRTIIVGFAAACFGYIAEMAVLIANHDKAAADHYAEAMKRYDKLSEMGRKLIHRALVDVDALVEVIATDMRKILDLRELTDRNLLFHLVQLDLETLKARLVEIHNDGAITLENHQLKSHRIICEVMDEENIREYSSIYDARTGPIKLDGYDLAFADTLDDMVVAKKVVVNGLIVIADDAENEQIAELTKELEPYYGKEGYTLCVIRNAQFERGCSAAFTDDRLIQDIIKYPDIGIYGDRYVYIGVPVPEGGVQRGKFERKAATVNKYLALRRHCLSHAITIPTASTIATGP